jgi:hypothetical protein
LYGAVDARTYAAASATSSFASVSPTTVESGTYAMAGTVSSKILGGLRVVRVQRRLLLGKSRVVTECVESDCVILCVPKS